jgi:hypothetical protein
MPILASITVAHYHRIGSLVFIASHLLSLLRLHLHFPSAPLYSAFIFHPCRPFLLRRPYLLSFSSIHLHLHLF